MAINKRKRAKVIAILSISAALIVVLQVLAQVIGHFTAFSLALGLLPVLVVAQLRDWKSGLFLGTVFGLCSLVIAAVLYAGIPAWETVIYPHISVLPRAIVGLVTSLVATAIGKALDKRVRHVCIDSTGIGVLVGAAHRAEEQQTAFAVASPQRNVARVLTLLGVGEKLGLRP
jgi:uncharacterized membrane protein